MNRSPVRALTALRIGTPIFLFIHGTTRLTEGSVGGFGEFLTTSGVPLGPPIAWLVTILEIVGTPLLAFGFFVMPLALFYAVELSAGIILVHFKEGWFVVGGGSGGMEYSVLLICVFLALAWGAPYRGKTVDS